VGGVAKNSNISNLKVFKGGENGIVIMPLNDFDVFTFCGKVMIKLREATLYHNKNIHNFEDFFKQK